MLLGYTRHVRPSKQSGIDALYSFWSQRTNEIATQLRISISTSVRRSVTLTCMRDALRTAWRMLTTLHQCTCIDIVLDQFDHGQNRGTTSAHNNELIWHLIVWACYHENSKIRYDKTWYEPITELWQLCLICACTMGWRSSLLNELNW
jgi:hypothetical protein